MQKRLDNAKLLSLVISLFVLTACGSNSKDTINPIKETEAQPEMSLNEINVNRAAAYIRIGIEQEGKLNHQEAKQKYSDAMQLLNQVLEEDNKYAPAHMTMAYLYERLGLSVEADKHYQRALKINANYGDAHNNYGQFLCKRGQTQAADEHFQAALAQPLYGRKVNTYTNAGMCALRTQQYARAHEYLLEAIQMNPYFLPALLQMANVKYYLQDNATAKVYLDRYVELAKTHTPQTLVLNIQIEKAQHNYDAVARYTSLLRTQFPDAPETLELNSILQQSHNTLSRQSSRPTVKLEYSEDITANE